MTKEETSIPCNFWWHDNRRMLRDYIDVLLASSDLAFVTVILLFQGKESCIYFFAVKHE